MISSAPILKLQRYFLQELAYIQIIQLVPGDLSILAHIVSIYFPCPLPEPHKWDVFNKVFLRTAQLFRLTVLSDLGKAHCAF